jgi:hypothetical protein
MLSWDSRSDKELNQNPRRGFGTTAQRGTIEITGNLCGSELIAETIKRQT